MTVRARSIVWAGIGTARFAETRRLFIDVLGLEVEAEDGDQAILRTANGDQVELFGRPGPGRERNSPPTVAFEVEDVTAARDALIAAGVEVVGEIGRWNGHEWLYFKSPDGYLFEVKSVPRGAGEE